MGNEDSAVNVEGAAKIPGTVTVKVTRSVEVEVRFKLDEVDALPDDVVFEMVVKVAKVVGKNPWEVVVELGVAVGVEELDALDELDETRDVVDDDRVVELLESGTVTKTRGTDVVVVVVL